MLYCIHDDQQQRVSTPFLRTVLEKPEAPTLLDLYLRYIWREGEGKLGRSNTHNYIFQGLKAGINDTHPEYATNWNTSTNVSTYPTEVGEWWQVLN